MSTTARQIDIRVGAVKRLTKEMKSRITDVETEKRRTQRFIDAGEDKWTVGKQVPASSLIASLLSILLTFVVGGGCCGGGENDSGC
jgi:hypothetical protein